MGLSESGGPRVSALVVISASANGDGIQTVPPSTARGEEKSVGKRAGGPSRSGAFTNCRTGGTDSAAGSGEELIMEDSN